MTVLLKPTLKLGLFLLFLFPNLNNYASFLDDQLKFSRVRTAHQNKRPIITDKLQDMDLSLNNVNVLIKAYKYEQIVQVYVKSSGQEQWRIYETFPFHCTSGELGPKRKEGDYQIPEGYYKVNHFNPYSSFLLSLGVSYPNKADKIKSSAKKKGSAIYIHGGCATIGCIPIENEPIQELYMLSVFAKNNGQKEIPIHILPFQYTAEKMGAAVGHFPRHEAFWSNLYEIEKAFQATKQLPDININDQGDYYLK